jgi:hypothetical protein
MAAFVMPSIAASHMPDLERSDWGFFAARPRRSGIWVALCHCMRFHAPRRITRALVVTALVACQRPEPQLELASAANGRFDIRARSAPADYDPLALAASSIGRVTNVDANIPPVCYTKPDGISNPCWTCHTHSTFPNLADDWELQQNYSFPVTAKRNHWRNLFRSRAPLVADFDDDALATYIRTDNYAPLVRALAPTSFAGWRPDLDFSRGFDANGFARDGTGWRAVRYKPFLGTFWPTNGSVDDVYIRLPAAFRRDARGVDQLEVYRANLAILEAAIAGDPRHEDAALAREIEPIDERVISQDLDRDGQLAVATVIRGLPVTYLGGAADVAVTRQSYPAGTELLHTLRYLDPDAPGFAATRMKEVRYARKVESLDRARIVAAYKALESPNPPPYTGDPLVGLGNGFGWQLQGWIEDARGWLRLQTHEEQTFCMGCHTGLGITVDQTFAFARKLPGREGWRVQDPRGVPDAPQIGHATPEYALYLARVRGGDELRANDELLARFFRDGVVASSAVAEARCDIGQIVLPSRSRAFALDRAYLANVIEQSYVWGRDAITSPVRNVNSEITERSTGIGEADLTVRDGRLHLDWREASPCSSTRSD